MPPVKELHFFDRDSKYPSPNLLATGTFTTRIQNLKRNRTANKIITLLRHGKTKEALWWFRWTFGQYDDSWYISLFAPGRSHKAAGEITPSYAILEKKDIARMKAINPDLKLIFLIRNPIDRAWSAIRLYSRTNPEFNINSDREVISLLQTQGNLLRGDYERTIDNFLQYFNSDQMLICFYDAIQYAPCKLMNDITRFLDVAPFEKGAIVNSIPVNSAPSHPMSRQVKAYLVELFGPKIEKMADRFGSYATIWNKENSISDELVKHRGHWPGTTSIQ